MSRSVSERLGASRSVSERLGVCDGLSRSVSEFLGVCLGMTWSVTLVSMERCGASGATLDPDLAAKRS